MPKKFFTSCLFSGLAAGIAVAALLHENPVSFGEESNGKLALHCGDRWFSADITLDTYSEIAHVSFDGALKPKRSYTDATLRAFVPKESFILKFSDGYGGRVRVYKDEAGKEWQAVLIEADKLPPRSLGTCRAVRVNA